MTACFGSPAQLFCLIDLRQLALTVQPVEGKQAFEGPPNIKIGLKH
jgi:hypothetical protein